MVIVILFQSGEVVTLYAHKVILAACSPFFEALLSSPAMTSQGQLPVVYLNGAEVNQVNHILDFIYHGQVNVGQDDLNSFLALAEDLKIKGISK